MSVRVMAWVWEHSESAGADRLVLLAIADCANDQGRDAYPSLATIAKKARMNKRTAQRSIRDLQARGELEVWENAGPHGTHRYGVLMAAGRQETTGGDTPRGNGETPPRQEATGDGDTSTKGRSDATRNILNPVPPQPPADAGAGGALDHCDKHSRFRKGCDRCSRAMAASKAKPPWCGECDETTRLMYDHDAAQASRCGACHPLRLSAVAV